MPDESLAAVLSQLAKSTGESFEPSDFTRRLRIQKSIYLLRILGYGPTRHYSFGSFVRGPYSPALTKDYYAIPKGAIAKAAPAAIPAELLKPVAYAIRRGNDFLESVATVHIYAARNPGSGKAAIFDQVLWAKPELRGHLTEAWAFLGAHGLLPGRT